MSPELQLRRSEVGQAWTAIEMVAHRQHEAAHAHHEKG